MSRRSAALAVVVLFVTSLALAQIKDKPLPPAAQAETASLYGYIAAGTAMSHSRESVRSINLSTTPGGGLRISDECDHTIIVEVAADGSIKGDKVRALRMMAAAFAAWFPEAAKPKLEEKKP